MKGGGSSVGRASDQKPVAILTQVRVPGVPGAASDYFFSPHSQFPVQTLRCPYSVDPVYSRVRQHHCVRTLKIPNTGNHTIVWKHENTAHSDGNG